MGAHVPSSRLYPPPPRTPAAAPRCSAGGRLWGVCRGSSFTDGCLIVGREAPKSGAPGGAASDFSGK